MLLVAVVTAQTTLLRPCCLWIASCLLRKARRREFELTTALRQIVGKPSQRRLFRDLYRILYMDVYTKFMPGLAKSHDFGGSITELLDKLPDVVSFSYRISGFVSMSIE